MPDVAASPPPPDYKDEKIEYDINSTHEQVIVDGASGHHLPVEEYQFTWRATIVGSLLGCLVGKKKKNVFIDLTLTNIFV